MKRITISVPDDLAASVEREAVRRRISVSQVAREGLQLRLGRSDAERTIPFEAIGRSGHRTTARDIEEILAVEWTDARDR